MIKFDSKENDDVDCCRKTLIRIKERLPEILENPIMKDFLKEDNEKIFYKALGNLEDKDILELNDRFIDFYRMNRTTRYLTGLIKRYSIDFDKRVKLKNNRYKLVMDKPISDDANATLGNLIANEEKSPYEHLELKENFNRNIFVTDNQQLLTAIEELTPKQIEILYLKYERGYNNKEIGEYFGQTEQNISYWHKKTLKQLREKIGG